jgi:hypothetical protein
VPLTAEEIQERAINEQKAFLKKYIQQNRLDIAAKTTAIAAGLIFRSYIFSKMSPGGKSRFSHARNSYYLGPNRTGLLQRCSIPLAILFAESFYAKKLQHKLNSEEPNNLGQSVPDFGGVVGTYLYSLFHKYFLNNNACLKRTIAAFEKAPEKFPEQAIDLLKKSKETFANMTPKELAEVCQQLRAMAEITK